MYLIDGFNPYWNPQLEYSRKDDDVKLYKLHGSITWYRSESDDYIRSDIITKNDTARSLADQPLVPLILYPGRKLQYIEPLSASFKWNNAPILSPRCNAFIAPCKTFLVLKCNLVLVRRLEYQNQLWLVQTIQMLLIEECLHSIFINDIILDLRYFIIDHIASGFMAPPVYILHINLALGSFLNGCSLSQSRK